MNDDVAARAEAPVSLWRRSVIGVSWSVCATERSVALAAASALPSIAYTAFSLFSHSSRADSTGAPFAFLAPLAIVAVIIASASAIIAVRLEIWWDG